MTYRDCEPLWWGKRGRQGARKKEEGIGKEKGEKEESVLIGIVCGSVITHLFLSMRFPRQEYRSGLPFPSVHGVTKESDTT